MPIRPFIFTDSIVLSALAAGTITLSISSGEKAQFRTLRFVATGAFNLVGIRDASGQRYSTASSDDPITSTLLQDSRNAFRGIEGFSPPLELEGPNALSFELTDTSNSSNTVRIVCEGEKEF